MKRSILAHSKTVTSNRYRTSKSKIEEHRNTYRWLLNRIVGVAENVLFSEQQPTNTSTFRECEVDISIHVHYLDLRFRIFRMPLDDLQMDGVCFFQNADIRPPTCLFVYTEIVDDYRWFFKDMNKYNDYCVQIHESTMSLLIKIPRVSRALFQTLLKTTFEFYSNIF